MTCGLRKICSMPPNWCWKKSSVEAALKILIVQTGFLGDVVLSTPVFSLLREKYPTAELTAITTPEAKKLLEFHPELTRVIAFDKRGQHAGLNGLREFSAQLRAERFDKVFSLH